MNIVVLRFLVDFALLCTMDHTTMHRDSLFQYSFNQARNIGVSESVDASL